MLKVIDSRRRNTASYRHRQQYFRHRKSSTWIDRMNRSEEAFEAKVVDGVSTISYKALFRQPKERPYGRRRVGPTPTSGWQWSKGRQTLLYASVCQARRVSFVGEGTSRAGLQLTADRGRIGLLDAKRKSGRDARAFRVRQRSLSESFQRPGRGSLLFLFHVGQRLELSCRSSAAERAGGYLPGPRHPGRLSFE